MTRAAAPRACVPLTAVLLLPAAALRAQEPTSPPPVNAGTPSERALTAPPEEEGFRFVVFGDRTTGKSAGLRVLRDAVAMSDHLDPDFVMTVGDMVQGYTDEPAWLRQAREYRGIMDRLRCPWYPVAGNHDVYARPQRPGGNTDLYRAHFGPLYYAFDYRWAHFVVLFSDEALSFGDPTRDQNVSPEQLEWLRADLATTRAEQVFVFLHHPRWLPSYAGCNWDRVHELLVADGRVRAVFAGHIHQYRDDGVRDGVHYYTLATVGAEKNEQLPAAAFDHVNLVSVRRGRFGVSVIPVGAALGGDAITGAELDALRTLVNGRWVRVLEAAEQAVQAAASSSFAIELSNPTAQPLRVGLELSEPAGWVLSHPPLDRLDLAPGETKEVQVQARAEPLAAVFAAPPQLTARTRFRSQGGREQSVEVVRPVPVRRVGVEAWAAERRGENQALQLDGQSAVRVDLPLEGLRRFTLECWARGEPPEGRMALVAKTESSSLGIFWSDQGRDGQRPSGLVSVGRGYLTARSERPWSWGQWTHLALVYDGALLRLFVGGQPAGEAGGRGAITTNGLPLYVGADPDGRGLPTSCFKGAIDELRLSSCARYAGPFTPAREHAPDEETLLLLHFDARLGDLFPDASGRGNHGRAVGRPRLGPDRSWN